MNPPTLSVYGIPNCDTVKKARTWLTEQGRAFTFHDFKKQGVPTPELDHWLDTLGWEKLLNRQGTTWRKLDAATQATVQDRASARALLLSQPSLIKRPVVDWGDNATPRYSVGFKADDWAAARSQ